MGRATLAGGHPAMKKPMGSLVASSLAVGSSAYLLESGVPVEYLVVNQGIPSDSTLYDESCNGTWLLRKDVCGKRAWHSSNVNAYAASTVHSYLNSTFLALFDSDTQNAMKSVKVAYVNGTGTGGAVDTGTNGLEAKIFLPSAYEAGLTTSDNSSIPEDGAKWDYFEAGNTTSGRQQRIAYLDGAATAWWFRSPNKGGNTQAWAIQTGGAIYPYNCTTSTIGIRPALILPSTAIFDEKTLLFKGVS